MQKLLFPKKPLFAILVSISLFSACSSNKVQDNTTSESGSNTSDTTSSETSQTTAGSDTAGSSTDTGTTAGTNTDAGSDTDSTSGSSTDTGNSTTGSSTSGESETTSGSATDPQTSDGTGSVAVSSAEEGRLDTAMACDAINDDAKPSTPINTSATNGEDFEAGGGPHVTLHNTLSTTGSTDALIRFVNASANASILTLSDNAEPLAGTSATENQLGCDEGKFRGPFSLPEGDHAVQLTSSDQTSLELNADLSLSAGTSTTLVVRGDATNAVRPLELLALRNNLSISSPERAKFRFVFAAYAFGIPELSAPNPAIDIYINTSGRTDQPTIEGLKYDKPSSNFIEIAAGTYQITVTEALNRENVHFRTELVFDPSQTTTVIIRDSSASDGFGKARAEDLVVIHDNAVAGS